MKGTVCEVKRRGAQSFVQQYNQRLLDEIHEGKNKN